MDKMQAQLIIHGGAGLVESPDFTEKNYDKALRIIIEIAPSPI